MKIKILIIGLISLSLFASCEDKTREYPESVIYSDMPENGYEIRVDSSFTFSPKITYDYSSTYTWTENGEPISSDLELTITPDVLRNYDYIFRVENDRGFDEFNYLAHSLYNTDFEELEVDSFWVNSDSEDSFTSGRLNFSINGNPDYNDDWYGFTYSNQVGSNTNVAKTYFRAYANPTEYTSDNFAILKQDSIFSPSFITFEENRTHKLKSISINNTYGTYIALKDGTEDSKAFGGEVGDDKDYFAINIIGHREDGSVTPPLQIFLADYRSDNNRENYIIRDWITVDIDELGFVNKLEITLISSDTVEGILKTPASICIDELKIIE